MNAIIMVVMTLAMAACAAAMVRAVEFVQPMLIQCDHGCVKVFPNWTRGRTRNSGEATLERDFKPGEVVSLTMTEDCAATAGVLSPISFDAPGMCTPMRRHPSRVAGSPANRSRS